MKTIAKRLTISGVSLAGVAGLVTLGVGGTSAEFTSVASPTTPYSLTNGSVNLTGTGVTDTPVVTSQGAITAPGDTTTHTYTLSYNGSLNAWVGLDTLVVSTINTAGGAAPYGNWGHVPFTAPSVSPASEGGGYLYQVAANNGNQQWGGHGSHLSSNVDATDLPTEVTCPTTFDGQTVPTSLTVADPTSVTGTKTVNTVYCYESPRIVVPYENADGTLHSPLTEQLSGSGSQTENGAWPAGNSTPSTLTLSVSLSLCGYSNGNNPPAYDVLPWNKPCGSPNVDNAYANQAVDVLIGATATAARNNTNAANDGPQGYSDPIWSSLPGPGNGLWG